MSSVPPKTRAAVIDDGPRLSIESIPTPTPAPHQVVVKVSAVAQNPTDVKSFDGKSFDKGAVLGCDFAGAVVSVGKKVSRLKDGDEVAGLVWGEINGLGAFSEYTLADEKIAFKVPKKISLAEAATMPLAVLTAWLALFSKGCLSIPRQSSSESVLIWGGSSSVGQYAIQVAALQGLRVITTCSPRNFDLVKRLGANATLDYRDDDVVAKITKAEPNLSFVFDTIGSADSSTIAAQCVKDKGKLCTVRPGKTHTEKVPEHVEVSDVLVWTAFLKDHHFGKFFWPASKEDNELASELCDSLPQLIESGKLLPNDVLQLNGLEDIPKGFEMFRNSAYSAQKIVYML